MCVSEKVPKESGEFKLAYLPNKTKRQNETYKYRSTHEQKSDGKFNQDSVLTYDSNE